MKIKEANDMQVGVWAKEIDNTQDGVFRKENSTMKNKTWIKGDVQDD